MDIAEALAWFHEMQHTAHEVTPRHLLLYRHTPPTSSSTVKRVSRALRALDLRVRRVLSAVRILRSPSSGLLGQGVRYGLAGAAVALVYLSTTTVLAEVVRIPFQIALAIGFSVALVAHFTLQRLFVWSHQEEFALPLRHQAGRYLTVAGTQYGLTIASTSLLPAALGVSTEIVYLVTVGVLASTNFLVFRHRIFHADQAPSFERDRADQNSVEQPTH